MKKLVLILAVFTSSLAYAEMNFGFDKRDEAVRPEPIVHVERYNPNQFRNDPAVLVSPARVSPTDLGKIVINPRRHAVKSVNPTVSKDEDVIVTTKWCDDSMENCK